MTRLNVSHEKMSHDATGIIPNSADCGSWAGRQDSRVSTRLRIRIFWIGVIVGLYFIVPRLLPWKSASIHQIMAMKKRLADDNIVVEQIQLENDRLHQIIRNLQGSKHAIESMARDQLGLIGERDLVVHFRETTE